MSSKDEQKTETRHEPDLATLNADDAVLGDEAVPPADGKWRPEYRFPATRKE